jgi:hypothetical protein
VGILAEMSTSYGGSDDDDLPTIEEILYTTLHKKGFTMEDRARTIQPSGLKK